MRKYSILIIGMLLLLLSPRAEACRFWSAVAEKVPANIIKEQLLETSSSLKFLGEEYPDGWSVGYYEDDVPMTFRGVWSSYIDEKFDRAVNDVSQMEPQVVFSHLRRASSGCVEGVPNPHPFEIYKNGKTWIFGHNGGIAKDILVDLIGEHYLKRNLPVVCTDNAPASWIDSELYFIYLMQNIEKEDFNVITGLKLALNKIYDRVEEDKRFLNFFLSDGESVWAFRKGTSLFYREYDTISYISSTIPDENQEGWMDFPENTIAEIKPNDRISFIPLKK